MRVLITGSRTWENEEQMQRILEQEFVPGATLVHGGAVGADRMAAAIWRKLGGKLEDHIPDWSQGRGAGVIRNTKMVDLGADLCLAFIRDNSRGASDCAFKAEMAKIPTKRFTHEGEAP